jgi:hypothetical protein
MLLKLARLRDGVACGDLYLIWIYSGETRRAQLGLGRVATTPRGVAWAGLFPLGPSLRGQSGIWHGLGCSGDVACCP